MSRAITVEDFLSTIEKIKDEKWPIYLNDEKINGMCQKGGVIQVYSNEVKNKLNNKVINNEITIKEVYAYLNKKSPFYYIIDEFNHPIRSIIINKDEKTLELS